MKYTKRDEILGMVAYLLTLFIGFTLGFATASLIWGGLFTW